MASTRVGKTVNNSDGHGDGFDGSPRNGRLNGHANGYLNGRANGSDNGHVDGAPNGTVWPRKEPGIAALAPANNSMLVLSESGNACAAAEAAAHAAANNKVVDRFFMANSS